MPSKVKPKPIIGKVEAVNSDGKVVAHLEYDDFHNAVVWSNGQRNLGLTVRVVQMDDGKVKRCTLTDQDSISDDDVVDYVRASDYDALQSQVDELRACVRELVQRCDDQLAMHDDSYEIQRAKALALIGGEKWSGTV